MKKWFFISTAVLATAIFCAIVGFGNTTAKPILASQTINLPPVSKTASKATKVVPKAPAKKVNQVTKTDIAKGKVAGDHLVAKLTKAEVKKVATAFNLSERSITKVGRTSTYKLPVPKGSNITSFQSALSAQGIVSSPDHKVTISLTPDDPKFTTDATNDALQWALPKIGAPAAWDQTTGSASTVIAVIDTGVNYNHEDLSSKMWTNTAELNGSPGVDDDGNGFIDDIYGYNFVGDVPAQTADPMDDQGHGTYVSSIAAAATNNTLGIAGTTWLSKIMAVKAFFPILGGATASANLTDITEAIYYAADNGANIINMSFGASGLTAATGGSDIDACNAAIQYAAGKGILLVAASGNEGATSVNYPANFDPYVMAVGSTSILDEQSSFSNGGPELDIAAPGEDIWGAWWESGNNAAYAQESGTSASTPLVVGSAALVWAQYPTLTAAEVETRLEDRATKVAAMGSSNFTNEFGFGRLNVADAVSPYGIAKASASLAISPSYPMQNDNVTATFKVKNYGDSSLTLDELLVSAKTGSTNYDFATVTAVTLAPGAEYSYSATRKFTVLSNYSAQVKYKIGSDWFNLYGNNFAITTSKNFSVSSFSLGYLKATSSLTVTPGTANVGQPVTAYYYLKNTSKYAVTLDRVGVAGRFDKPSGTDPVRDFPFKTNVSIPAYGTVKISVVGQFHDVGKFYFWPYVSDNGKSYSVAPSSSSYTMKRFLTTTLPTLRQTSSLTLSTYTAGQGESVTATFKLKNIGSRPAYLLNVCAAGRLGTKIVDFPHALNVVINPGATYTYSKTYAYSSLGSYYIYSSRRDWDYGWRSTTKDPSTLVSARTLKVVAPSFAVTTSLGVTPTQGSNTMDVTATYTVKNVGSRIGKTKLLGVSVRNDGIYDFPFDSDISILPGASYSFSATKTFSKDGLYSCATVLKRLDGAWVTIPAASGKKNTATFKITSVSGWVFPENETWQDNKDRLNYIHPFWYKMNGAAVAEAYPLNIDPAIVTSAQASGIKVLPTITGGTSSDWLLVAGNRTTAANNIYNLVTSNGYDGIDIDFENMDDTHRDAFSDFMTQLATKLHASAKKLSVCSWAKPSEPGLWNSHKSIDWPTVGAVVDRFNIMFYNYHYSGSTHPGPQAPLGWVQQVVDFAKTQMPASKVVIGVAGYGLAWVKDGSGWDTPASSASSSFFKDAAAGNNPDITVKSALSYTCPDEPNVYGGDPYVVGKAPHFDYVKESTGEYKRAYYEDAQSTQEKLDLAKAEGIAGIVVWRIDVADPGIWNLSSLNARTVDDLVNYSIPVK